jgi:hypothetical protein
MAVTVRGVVGEVRWAYHVASAVTGWTIVHDAGVSTLIGTLDHPDPFRLSQQPLVFVASHAGGAWRWPIRELQITGASLAAVLGPKET